MFKLVRFFSLTSLTAFVAVALILGVFYRQLSITNLIAVREAGNYEVTQLFINAVWEDYSDFFLNIAPDLSTEEILEHPTTQEFRQTVLSEMDGLQIVKVKVFAPSGRTLFSTEAEQIGQGSRDNLGFVGAMNGEIVSDLSRRDQFNAFEGVIEDRDMISSYVPLIPNPRAGEIAGVMEVYEDVTPLLERINQTQFQLIAGVVVLLATLYVALLLIVARAQRVMVQQQVERDQALAALRASEAYLLDLVQNAPVLIWNITQDRTVKTLEGRQLENRDINPNQYVGRPVDRIDLNTNIDETIERAFEGKEAQVRLSINNAAFETRFAPIFDENNHVTSVIGISTDITDILMAESQLTTTRQKLEERNKRLEEAMNFTQMTLATLRESIRRGASPRELVRALGEADMQFDRITN